ncbi:MAG: RluA family pseudouridine synthase [Solirubrobacteraceae bacterium]
MMTAKREWEGVVSSAEAGQRLDQFLAPAVGSRSRAERLMNQGLVTVDGVARPKRYIVANGEQVVVTASAPLTPATGLTEPAPYTVIYEDDAVLVVDKPAGVVVHPARGHEQGTLVQALAGRARGGDEALRPGIVHRLDRDTSGLLVVAKSDQAHRRLREMLAEHEIHREYLALVDGRPPARTGTIEAPIGRDRQDRLIHSLNTDVPREARTHFELVEPLAHDTLLRVTLDTGRTHQIRVHMQAIGHPVVGDIAYGGPARYGLTRQFLHATRLAFPHPISGTLIALDSQLPTDLQEALVLARRASGGR